MFKKFKEWLLKRELAWYRQEIDRLRKKCDDETRRADKNYRDQQSANNEIWPLKRKLNRSRAWNQKIHDALKKAKEQSRRDHEHAEQQKQRIEDLKAEIAHLWEGKEEIALIRVDDDEEPEFDPRRCTCAVTSHPPCGYCEPPTLGVAQLLNPRRRSV